MGYDMKPVLILALATLAMTISAQFWGPMLSKEASLNHTGTIIPGTILIYFVLVFTVVGIGSPFLLHHIVVRKVLFTYSKRKWVHNIAFSRFQRLVFRFPLNFTDHRLCFELVANRNLDSEIFHKLVQKNFGPDVRMALADNPSTPADILFSIVEKEKQAARTVQYSHIVKISQETRKALIRHPKISEETKTMWVLELGIT